MKAPEKIFVPNDVMKYCYEATSLAKTEFTGGHYYHLAPRWVSVEERLPENGVYVLMAHWGSVYSEAGCYQKDGGWEWFNGSRLNLEEPSHWMPLPAPPEDTE